MAGANYPRIAGSTTVPYGALRAHASTTTCLLLLFLYCSPTTALRPISRQFISNLHDARRGRGVSARTVLPPAAQRFAAPRAEETSAEKILPAERAFAAERAEGASAGGGTSSTHGLSTSLGLRVSAASPQASEANTAALKAIFTAALLPIPVNKANACAWPGVTCAANGAVVALNLTSSVSRPIPAFCQAKQVLTFLNLAHNALSGPPTPLSPSCSASLSFLYLSSNRLSGPIPATISSFTRLKRLLLDKNTLAGSIPAGVSKLQRLQGLGLSYNTLSGTIPAVWPAGIQNVLLAGNRLSGAVPVALSKLKRGSFKPGNPNLCGKPLPACA
ncbi:unnamed protein product [Closterium sp. NIES-64]|nr:unnamed protein product [Closterium sp. NIES-64]